MALNVLTLGVGKGYTDNSIAGTEGVIAGKNCTIKNIVKNGDTNTITFEWTADDGTTRTETMTIKDGAVPVKRVDYFTSDDIDDVVTEVLRHFPLPIAEEASF